MKTSTKAKAKASKAKAAVTKTANNISDSVKQAVAEYDWNKEVIGVGVGVAGREIHVAASTKDLIQATGIAAAVAGVCYLVMK